MENIKEIRDAVVNLQDDVLSIIPAVSDEKRLALSRLVSALSELDLQLLKPLCVMTPAQ